MSQEKPWPIDEALRCAVSTAETQPSAVPACPDGWLERARAAADSDDREAIRACAEEIWKAHHGYRAEFDIKGWLYELRISIDTLKAQEAAACPVA